MIDYAEVSLKSSVRTGLGTEIPSWQRPVEARGERTIALAFSFRQSSNLAATLAGAAGMVILQRAGRFTAKAIEIVQLTTPGAIIRTSLRPEPAQRDLSMLAAAA
jgi:hypothetical protein